jgi:hypothetical protein
MINEHGRASGPVNVTRFVFGPILLMLMAALLLTESAMIGRAFQQQIMEYYIYYRGNLAGFVHQQRYEHAFATRAEAEKARQQAARDTGGDPQDFLADTYIKEVPTGRYTTPPPNPVPSPSGLRRRTPTTVSPTSPTNTAGAGANQTNNFEADKADLLKTMKGIDSGGLDLKTGTDVDLKPKAAPPDPEVVQEQKAFEEDNPGWKQGETKLVQQRLVPPNRTCSAIYASLKIKAPPLPYRKFNEMQPGDVLLIRPNEWKGEAVMYGDRLLSWDRRSPLSHTITYLKEINGKKIFLDNLPGEGPHFILEDEVRRLYSERGGFLAQLAEPLRKDEAEKLFLAARELALKERTDSHSLLDASNYGVWGDDMVCSEASRWALMMAGRNIKKTGSFAKRILGIDISPSDIWLDEQDFIITPLDFSK